MLALDAQGKGRHATVMLHHMGRDSNAVELRHHFGLQFAYSHFKLTLHFRRTRKQTRHRCHETLLQTGWSGDRQRVATLADQLRVEDREGQAAEVVAVQVTDDNGVYYVRVHIKAPHRNHGRRTPVNEEGRRRGADKQTGVKTAAVAKRIAATPKTAVALDCCQFSIDLSRL